MPTLSLTVNGVPHSLDVPGNRFLAEVLRYDLGLTGTKIGCNEAECGACTVVVNGRSVDSCIYPAFKAQNAEVLTIEGVAGEWQRCAGCTKEQCDDAAASSPAAPVTEGEIELLHPLQQAFVLHGATQCGYCTPGFIMQVKTLLDANPEPTDDEIKHCLKDTYCRCTGYASILTAIKAAAEKMRTGHLPLPHLPETVEALDAVGQPLPRPDAIAKVTGQALYSDDYLFEGMLHGATLRSEHPHARILSIDTSAALAQPGVHVVLTHADVPGDPRHGLVEYDWPVFAGGPYPARYVGDPIALVVADTKEQAQDGAGTYSCRVRGAAGRDGPGRGTPARRTGPASRPADRQPAQAYQGAAWRRSGRVCAGRRDRGAHLSHADDGARLLRAGVLGGGARRVGGSTLWSARQADDLCRQPDPLLRPPPGGALPGAAGRQGPRQGRCHGRRLRRQGGYRRAGARGAGRHGDGAAGQDPLHARGKPALPSQAARDTDPDQDRCRAAME